MNEEISSPSRLRLLGGLGVIILICVGILLRWPAALKPFLLAMASGGIAVFGDWIGQRVGKRRYSLFRWRPSITARVVAILTGVIIAGVLMVIIFTTSENAQQAFFRFREFKDRFENLQMLYSNLQVRKEGLEKQIPDLQRQAQRFERQRDQAQGQRNAAQQKRDQALQERDQAQRERERAERRLRKTHKEYRHLTEQLRKLQSQVRGNQAQLTRTEENLKRAEANLQKTRRDLQDAQDELQKAQEESWKAVDVLKQNEENLKAEIAKLEGQRNELTHRISADQGEILTLQQRLQELTQVAAGAQMFLEREVIYLAGESLGQAVVDGTRPAKAIRERLVELLEAASTQAALRGAGKGPNGRYVTAFRVVTLGNEIFVLAEEDLLTNIAQSLADRKDSVVMQVLAARNTVEGEWVHVEFARPQPNRRIFQASDEITRRVIDGTLSDAKIFTELLGMLQDVRTAARNRGLIPTLPGGRYGEISYPELFPVLHRVQEARKPIPVRILALQETWTADPLQIRFVVGEEPSQS